MNRLNAVLCGIILAALPSTSALADTVYTYTGNPFTTSHVGGIYTPSDFISGSFTVATPLAPDSPYGAITPESFTFSDGIQTFDASNTPLTFFGVATDDTGNIVGWYISLLSVDGVSNLNTGNGYIVGVSDEAKIDQAGTIDRVFVFNDPGTWTESSTDPSPVPEPSSIVLFGTGALGLAGSVRRKFLS